MSNNPTLPNPIIEFLKCSGDAAYFIHTYGHIQDRHDNTGLAPLLPFKLWPAQTKLMWQFMLHRLIVILKARQLGISWLVCGYALWLCLFSAGKLVLFFSKTEGDAEELLRRVNVIYDNLPDFLKERCPRKTKDNTETIEFNNGSKIESKAATKTAGRGDTASLVVLDEFAFMQYAASVHTAAKPTLDAGGQMIVLSTADGIGNAFHTLYSNAKNGINGFLPVFLSYLCRPGRSPLWRAQKLRESLEPQKIPQEYPETDTEAFIASAHARFLRGWIEAQKKFICAPLERLPDALKDVPGVKVWKLPQNNRLYEIAADVAEGGEDGDWDDATVIDRETLEEVAALRGQWEPGVYGGYLDEVATFYNRARVTPERNNHGHTVIWELRQRGANVGRGLDHKWGWLTSSVTKPQLIDHYAEILRDSADGSGLKLRDENAVDEASIYERKPNGSTGAPQGKHDDAVMSRAIGVFMARRMPALKTESGVPISTSGRQFFGRR